jgi:hypothetical protein
MSLSSLMPREYVDELSSCYYTKKELTVLRFLEGIFEILKINTENLDKDTLRVFKKAFCQDDPINGKPYRRMIKSYIITMKSKVSYAEKNALRKRDELQSLLDEAKKLLKNVTDYFEGKIGDIR